MNKNNRDWGKTIFRIVILLFIVFFIGRWFMPGREDSDSTSSPDTSSSQVTIIDEPEEPEAESGTEAVTYASEQSDDATEEKAAEEEAAVEEPVRYEFRNRGLLDKHYEKHGIEMGFASAEEYEAAASAVVTNPNALHKLEQEDGDDVFYLEDTGEFVIVSTDGFIRTYYYASRAYFDRQ